MPARPVIAIVGRPNVGKSTLFNRLIGRRAALVSNLPGLTRDRREETCEIAGNEFKLIDTAGLEEAPRGSIPARMREQSELAIADADLVLFVIDARAGITPADKQFASIVRRSGHPAILVANKCEGRQGTGGYFEAFELGIGEPVAISAEHGEGIVDLETDILTALGLESRLKARPGKGRKRGKLDENFESAVAVTSPGETSTEDEVIDDDGNRPIRVAIVGRPNAGKSTLVNALLGEDRMITGPEPGLTRDTIASDIEWQGRPIRLFDTAGLRRKSRIDEKAEKLSASDTVRAIRFAEVVVLLIDAERGIEHQDLTIGQMVTDEGRALVIAINKWDTEAEKQNRLRSLREAVAEKLAQVPDVPVITISALAEQGLEKLLGTVVSAYEVWNRRISTSDLNTWLREAVERHRPPAVNGRRIRIRYMTQPSSRPPTFIAFCSQPKGLPASYIRYLTNGLREAFGLPGTPIRLNLRKGANPYSK
jgi:GTPase